VIGTNKGDDMLKKLATFATLVIFIATPAFASKETDDVAKQYLQHYKELKDTLDTDQELMLMRLNSDTIKMLDVIEELGKTEGRLSLLLELQFDCVISSEQGKKYTDGV